MPGPSLGKSISQRSVSFLPVSSSTYGPLQVLVNGLGGHMLPRSQSQPLELEVIDSVESPLEQIDNNTEMDENQGLHLLNGSKLKYDMGIPPPEINKNSIMPLLGILLFGIVYILPIMQNNPTEHTCLAMVIMVCYYWISESIPPFAASYIIPIVSVFLQIGIDKNTGNRYSSQAMAVMFASKFMDPVIFVFLGSLTMSSALSKLDITTRISRAVLKHVHPTRSVVLLVLMLLNVAIASVLSNVASTTLVLSLALPIIRSLDYHDPFNKAILLGICWSGNCGGMATIIASPQNVLAAAAVSTIGVDISFLQWICFATPVSLVLVLLFWGFLCIKFIRGGPSTLSFDTEAVKGSWTIQHTLASAVTVFTIFLWAFGDSLGTFMGHTGIAALIPVVYFFASGVLTISDFNTFKWSTLALLGGGLALGEAMKVSGLLDFVGDIVKPALAGVSVSTLLVSVLLAEGVLASLLSSTTAASILFPLIIAVCEGTGRGPVLVVLSALMISGAQLFHISSFPNALVSGVCEEGKDGMEGSGAPYLSGLDFILNGWPTILISVGVISTLGYLIVTSLNI